MRATTRTLTRLVGAHLGIDSVPYAARLVRTGDMLRSNEEADEFDAAALLAAILAAPVPEMAVDALDTLGESTLGPATWTPTGILAALQPAGVEVLRESDRLLLPVSPVDLLVELILMPQGDIRLAELMVEVGGWSAKIELLDGDCLFSGRCLRASYKHPDAYRRTGLKRYRELPIEIIGAVAELLKPTGARPAISIYPHLSVVH